MEDSNHWGVVSLPVQDTKDAFIIAGFSITSVRSWIGLTTWLESVDVTGGDLVQGIVGGPPSSKVVHPQRLIINQEKQDSSK